MIYLGYPLNPLVFVSNYVLLRREKYFKNEDKMSAISINE
jgi:hypothetical protein